MYSQLTAATNDLHRAAARAAFLIALALAANPAHAQLSDLLKKLPLPGSATGGAVASAALSDSDVIAGLKEALAQGAESAINGLGTKNGFLGNPDVRIPLPGKLASMETALRTLRQGQYVDDFVTTMNRAAERAVPEASAVIGDAIRQMSVADGRNILSGPDDAATAYFRKVGEQRLTDRLRPIVAEATAKTGVTGAYKGMADRAGPAASLLGMGAPDLDGYVTDKALDGLFLMIAAEEKRIRDNPLARSSDLLKKVFGGAAR